MVDGFARILLLGQGAYFLLTGLWPLVHLPSFIKVTGRKTDYWLVRMVGALAAVIGLVLLVAIRDGVSPAIAILAVGSAIAFLGVDVVYVKKRVIGPVYLWDAAAEAVFLLGWGIVALRP